jgi:hypothetical protein
MNSSNILKSALLLAVFLQTSATSRADGEKEIEALRKEIQALRAEVETLVKLFRTTKKDAETKLLEKTREVDELRRALFQAESEARRFKLRASELNAELKELERKVGSMPMKDPPARRENFPAAKIEGRIVEIDKESKLLKLSIGSDAGLAQGQHLHVYRVDPVPEKSKYLGTIEVLTVRPTEAVARISKKMPASVVLQPGDQVVSQLFDPKK